METKRKMRDNVWNKNSYYDLIDSININWNQPGMKLLKNAVKKPGKILDLGCGEGSRIKFISNFGMLDITGVDISQVAISRARMKTKGSNFQIADLEKLPFPNNIFDIVYSFYVFEHLVNPEKVIKEAVRVLNDGGLLLIVCPNYGAPNRSSPPANNSRILKLVFGFIDDLVLFFQRRDVLGWKKVAPIANEKEYAIDWDTTIEPYVLTLIRYLSNMGMKIENAKSYWEDESKVPVWQMGFKFFYRKNIYPFKYWGTQIVVAARK